MFDISFCPVNDVPSLELRWRALEAASQGGFFRGWTYLSTLLPQFSAPYLLAVRQRGQDVALGLFNAARAWHGKRFSLNEAGTQPWDSLFVEHNGLLLRPGAEACLPHALASLARQGALTLSGIDTQHLQAAERAGQVSGCITRQAPAIDLAALTASGRSHLDAVSANARAQIRRAMRLYGPELGIAPARDLAEALAFLDRLIVLHQASWTARGKPGAFADPAIRAWHASLVRAALPRQESALLRISVAGREVGILYQFQHGGRVLNYQAGLVAEADARLKPGLVCHALAIEHARAEGAASYDFLAGAQRYKTTLVPRGFGMGQDLHWLTLHRRGSLAGRLVQLRQMARQVIPSRSSSA